MKIGLEFEGVIRNFATGEISRWSKIPADARMAIKKQMFVRRQKVDPCDRYDALAEVRTIPIENPTAEKLITALFTEMEAATYAFVANGYFIQWFEQPIPKELHDEIRHDKVLADPDGKKDKITYTIKDGVVGQYVSEGNLFRGGGLHINISSIPNQFAPGVAINLHGGLQHLRLKEKFQSHYRNNLLYRTKEGAVCVDYSKFLSGHQFEPIVEYMSHGFNVQRLEGWQKELAYCVNQGYGFPPKFEWAFFVVKHLQAYFDSLKLFK